MAWEEDLEPDWFYELPFYLVATIAYGAVLTVNPILRWGAGKSAADQVVPIEFVAALPPVESPKPTPALAPTAAGKGKIEPPPRKGPGAFVPEKKKAGAADAPPKPAPRPGPAARKSNREKPGATIAATKPKTRPAPAKTIRAAPEPEDLRAAVAAAAARRRKFDREKTAKDAADRRAAELRTAQAEAAAQRAAERKASRAAAVEAAAEKAAELKAARAAAAQAAAEKTAQAKAAAQALAEQRAEAAREKEAAAAAEKARRDALARVEAQRRADAERARREELAAQRAAKAKKKAELSQELATMTDPDEALAQDADSPAPARGGGAPRGKVLSKSGAAAALADAPDAGRVDDAGGGSPPDDGAALAGARKAGAAAALADTAESANPGDAAGAGGGDLLSAKAKGGGLGPDGSGVSYSLDGPIGSRRVLKRAVPSSPDWVGSRGLDLTVTVRFQVLPDGTVKPGAVIQKTSGFPEIDKRALDALRRWRFEAAPAGDSPEVWGRAAFRFTS